MTVTIIKDSDDWELRRFHGRRDDGDWLQWKLTDEGILVQGEEAVRRTPGKPVTLTRIVDTYGDTILKWADVFDLSEQLLAAVIAIESGGRPTAEKEEKHKGDWSIGLTQVLTATAKHLVGLFPEELPPIAIASLPKGGSLDAWRTTLRDPETSIALAGAYLRAVNDDAKLRLDPVLLYCAYNAGSVRPHGSGARAVQDNPWGLKHYRHYNKDGTLNYSALSSFCAWFGDAVSVYGVC